MKLSSVSSLSGAWLLVGNPGTGKTTLCTQLPNAIIFEIDNNLSGPMNECKRQGLPMDCEVEIPHIKPDGTLVPRIDRYLRLSDLVCAAILNPAYKTIVIDSLTTLCDYIFDEVRRQNKKKIGNPMPTTKTESTIDENLSLPDWGHFMALLRHLITTCKASGKLFVLTAHTMTDKDEMAGYLKTYISMPTSMKENIAGYFDEVILLTKVEDKDRKAQIKIQTVPGNGLRQESLGLKSAIGLENGSTLDFTKLKQLLSA